MGWYPKSITIKWLTVIYFSSFVSSLFTWRDFLPFSRITSFFLYIIFIYLTLFCCCIICTCIKLIIILFYIFRTKRVLFQFTNVLSLPLSLHKNPHPNDFVILWQRNTFQLAFFSQIVVLTHLIQCLVFLNSILNWLGLVCKKNKRKGK